MRLSSGREKKRIKVVLDTNVLVSAFLFRKRLHVIRELLEQGVIISCFTSQTFEELRNVFSYTKFKTVFTFLNIHPSNLLEIIAENSIILQAPAHVPNIIKDDPPDNHLLACAITCDVTYIVSGDKHLLKLKKFNSIPIFSPAQFLQQIQR